MSFYYPQSAVKLRILPEDYKLVSDASLQSPIEVITQAKMVSVTRNDYKTADSFNMKLDYKSFPFDPRSIRACGVVIYMQDTGKLEKLVPSQDNAVFAGYVDTEEIMLDENAQTVTFEGRDFTALLIDQKYAIKKPISEQKPLDKAITEFLGQVPALQNMVVVNRTGELLPSLGAYYPNHADPLNGQKNPGSKESYWSLIQDACNRAGIICFMELENLVLTTPRNQADTVGDDIKFIYGKNVKKFEFKRKLGRLKGINVQVRSRVGKKVNVAKIPAEATPAWCTAFGITRAEVVIPVLMPSGIISTTPPVTTGKVKFNSVTGKKAAPALAAVAGQPAPYLSFNIPNIASHAALVTIGQTLYEQYSLQQLEGSLTTKEMVGHGPPMNVSGVFSQRTPIGTQLNQVKKYDLTQLKKGQSICLEIDTDDLAAIARFQDAATREQYLVKRNYDRKIAAIFAKTLGKFSPRFQIKSFTMTLDAEVGFDLTINFQNLLILTGAGL